MVDRRKESKPRIGMKTEEDASLPISTHSSCSSPLVGVSIDIDYSEQIIEETPLTCAVCQDTYSDPRILPCLHSFCKGCLSKLASISTSIKCPLCRNEHTLSPKGIDELLPNTQLARKVETLSTTMEISKCDQCEETNVVSFCSNCESYLCKSCDGAHKKMLVFKNHVLLLPKLAKKNPKVKSFMCPKHSSEALSVYCIDCKSVICRDCGLYDHNGHKFKPAVDASDEIRKSLVSNSKQLTTKLKTFRSHSEEISKVEKHVTVYPDTMKSFITSQFEELHKLLDKRKEELLQQVDSQYNGFSKTLWAEKDIIETGICKLEAGINFAEQLAKSDDKLEIAVLGTKALESMEQVTEMLSWDPKNIENISPLAYAAQEGGDTDKGYIKGIGIVKSIEIVITDGNYMYKYASLYPSRNNYFQINGNYCVEIEIKANHHFKIVFPQMSLLCSCKRGNEAVSCTTEHKSDKWKVTFQTKYAGSYTIEAVLKVNGKNCCKKIKNIELPYEPVHAIKVNSSMFSAGIGARNTQTINYPNPPSPIPVTYGQVTSVPEEPMTSSSPLTYEHVTSVLEEPMTGSSPHNPLPVTYGQVTSVPEELMTSSSPLTYEHVTSVLEELMTGSSPHNPLPVTYGQVTSVLEEPMTGSSPHNPLPVTYNTPVAVKSSPSPSRLLPAESKTMTGSSPHNPLPVTYNMPVAVKSSPSPSRLLPAESKTINTTFGTREKEEKKSDARMTSVADTQPLHWPLYNQVKTEKKKKGKFQWS